MRLRPTRGALEGMALPTTGSEHPAFQDGKGPMSVVSPPTVLMCCEALGTGVDIPHEWLGGTVGVSGWS